MLINVGIELCSKIKLHPVDVNNYLISQNSSPIESTESVSKLCRRPEVELKSLLTLNGFDNNLNIKELLKDDTAARQVEIELKYEGYIKRQQETIARVEKYEDKNIPLTLNYLTLNALSTEAKEKLNKIKPRSIGQASRISGVTPSDISILLVYLRN